MGFYKLNEKTSFHSYLKGKIISKINSRSTDVTLISSFWLKFEDHDHAASSDVVVDTKSKKILIEFFH